ncbi:glycosyltransferase involved in cell wall biosynthesis [Neisseria sp. HSC-16F19]|nr:glycosyltransferase [Neisseria sp. HSC-16F19]MCP2041411.1 glycosyltransferase involved in cell wall biosynthesis [Neisseria sp. HSC-16F19]
MNNLHVSLTEFRHESRVIKQTTSLVQSGLVDNVYIAALHADGLPKEQEYFPSVICKRFKLKTRSLSKNLIFQGIKYLEFCWQIYRSYKKNNIKIVNIHNVGLLPLGVLLKKLYRAKLVYDTHELETETHSLKGRRKKLAKLLEKTLIRYVDLTLVVSENIADWYASEYQTERPPVIMNTPVTKVMASSNIFREHFNIKNDQIIFLYQGGLIRGRGVELILEAFKSRKDDQAVVVFMGFGQLEESIREASINYSNIFFMPAVSPDQVLNYTASADVGFSLAEKTCLSHFYCMPNKLFEYLMAGLVVVVSNMKEMSEFVSRNQCGFVLESADIESLNAIIDNVIKTDLVVIKQKSYQTALSYCWENQEKKMLVAYQDMLNTVN